MRTSLLTAVEANQQKSEPAFMEVEPSGVRLQAGAREYFRPLFTFSNGETDAYLTLAACAEEAQADGIELKGCASCARFRFSGMSQQFSAGRSGYCSLAGFRSLTSIVSIDHGCGEYVQVPGWPANLDVALHARIELSDREPKPSRLNAFAGAIMGLAVGDALGFPAEFHQRAEILSAFGPEGLRDFVSAGPRYPAGAYTDDTQMTLAVAEALIEFGREQLDTLMHGMASRFLAWSRSEENNRAPGATVMAACNRIAAGTNWRESGIANSKGCGSAMRVAPIGLFFWRDIPRMLEIARASSLITHGHDAAIEGASAAALLVALAMSKRSPEQMFQALMEECAPRSPDLKAVLEKLPQLLEADPAEALSVRGLGEGWVAEEAVTSALYCFWRSPLDFEQSMIVAANTDGDSDSIACIAGGISGAFNGLSVIPERWQKGVENAAGLMDVAQRLYDASNNSH
ncbi:MAG: ADP-ribosylglycohydrolase family protein [Bryobacteraceae bacterium]|jgi:ADP-ribosylglycohydrolase